MNKGKEIQKLAFVDPTGKNLEKIKKIIYKTIELVFKKISNAENYPLIIDKKVFEH